MPLELRRLRPAIRGWTNRLLELSNRMRLPSGSALPVAGAVVGLYAGLAAGIFANLIGFFGGIALNLRYAMEILRPGSPVRTALAQGFAHATWHTEYAIIALPFAGVALLLVRLIEPGGPRDIVRRRLRVLALLTLGGVALDYPLVALSVLNSVFARGADLVTQLRDLPPWTYLIAPALGGMLVGRLLRNRPHLHGHGVPEVLEAVDERPEQMSARGGLLKLVASAVTIGSGGSGGREGPIVYGGAAFGSSVGRTLGFTRNELAILLACGAGSGIAASFGAPIGGAIFGLEIILRNFELKALSPVLLASVTATLVSEGTLGIAPALPHLSYSMHSGWEIVAYVILGLVCGALATGFIEALHGIEHFFQGGHPHRFSVWLGGQPLWARAGIGGMGAGLLALISPCVWGTGQSYSSLATQGQLALWVLATGCAFKLLGTALTIGSGGSGGTFFPATVIGAMGGGFLGELFHFAAPSHTAPSGAYAMVGMAGVVAGLTRGPLTGMVMLYELSQDSALILPLMVTCSIASAVTHQWMERINRRRTPGALAVAATEVPQPTPS